MESQKRMKIPHLVIVRAPGLLPMLYTLRELGEELDIPMSTLRDWLQAGAPYERDNRNHLWVNGESFAAWIKTQQKPRPHRKLETGEGYCMHCNQITHTAHIEPQTSCLPGEGYCMHCNQITRLVSPEVRHIKGKLIHIKGKCPQCGHTINRGGRYDRTTELS